MPNVFEQIRNQPRMLLPLLPLIVFLVPLAWLYFLDASSFESMWKGRTFELFFVWLIGLELILGWENFKETKLSSLRSLRTILLALIMILPTIYVLASYYLGLNQAITNWSLANNLQGGWGFSNATINRILGVWSFLYSNCVLKRLAKKGLVNYAIPAFFMVMVGAIYIIDNVYPYGQFTLFQFFCTHSSRNSRSHLQPDGLYYKLNRANRHGTRNNACFNRFRSHRKHRVWYCMAMRRN